MKRNFLRFIFIFLVIFSCSPDLSSQQKSLEALIDQLYSRDGELYFCYEAGDRTQINGLSRLISIDKIEEGGKVYAYANRKEFSKFLEYGIRYEILPHPGDFSGNLNIKHSIDVRNIQDWDFYPSYDAYVDMMYQFAETYPSLCQVVSIGTSIQGREILFAKISDNISMTEKEPQILYTSSIHGDELTGYVLMLRLIDYLLSNYGDMPKVTGLVDNVEIWINPLANPDGTYAGGNNSVNGARRYNANWIDLNRNYPDPDDGPHPDGEEWQKETQLFMELAEDNHFVCGFNIHGGEEVCNYPWDTWSKLSADDDWWQYVCHEYADTVHLYAPSGYMSDFDNGITNGYAWYTITGGRQDYMNYFHQMREFTLEISDVKLLDPGQLPAHWNYNYRSFLNYIEQSTFGVRGTVKDSITGWPIQAEVYAVLHEFDSSWVYSDLPNGNYHRLLHEGTYTMKYSAPGYTTRVFNNVQVTNRQATMLDVKLLPDGVGGIDNPFISQIIDIHPNPVRGDYLFFNSTLEVDRVMIYDLSGFVLINQEMDQQRDRIYLGYLKAGMYIVRFDTEKGVGLEKLIINR
jgi:hypothetical protein